MMLEAAILRNETVMHRLTHILACGTVVLHMVVGCCWHHAHAACVGDCTESPPAAACRSCDDHRHGDHRPCPGEHRHERDHGCDTAPCVFVAPEKESTVEIASPEPLAPLAADADVPRLATQLPSHLAGRPQSRLGGPLRLHLVNQVLLL